ncbi:PCYCGC motif-containing (lipo)protein [Sutcliffiella halmapala]|uniref:PCYCGC motif-containing (lipo)protein n=1 Tax=Sutcliffiella halmapala TaxID=79882 RepID=UPI0009952124|nr:PCYCGC motif-containing (lipo)protein [Sutcliffiella halmapala]
MKKTVFILSALLFLLAACSNNSESNSTEQSHEEGSHQHNKPSFYQGDLREKTASVEELPSFLDDKPEDMTIIYSAAAQHQEVLEQIPCYCGCGTSAGHKSSYQCFVHEVHEDGSIDWDDHGTRCGVCLEIAASSIVEYSKGKSIIEIRDMIDETYKEGYATPTPTPMPKTN